MRVIQPLVAPRSIAVIGASTNAAKSGGVLFSNLRNGGFSGPLYPINPKAPEVMGLKAYPDLKAVPEQVDLVYIVLPSQHTEAAIQQCVEARARAAYEECLPLCDPPPPPATCEERCKLHAASVAEECIAAGGSPEDCRARALRTLEACLGRCEPAPPPHTCAERCELAAKELLERCLMDPAADPEACREKARHLLRECRMHCEVPNPPGCKDRCELLAQKVREECAGEDGTISCPSRLK